MLRHAENDIMDSAITPVEASLALSILDVHNAT